MLTLRGHALVLLVFAGLVSVYTWPLVTNPGHLLPNNHDPRLYGWVMPTIFRNLLTQPTLLYQGNAFYPVGNSLTFAESLLTPALIAGPLYVITGNPVLAYNLTLLFLWALSGWAMYAVTYWVTRHHPGAFVAALAFTLCPMRIEYYLEFQIQTMFGIPLAVYFLVRFFEGQGSRQLLAALAFFWVQAMAVQYYTVILGLGLAMVALQCLALRWPLWRPRTFVIAALGPVVLALALAPTLLAYALTRRALGFERSLDDASSRSADVLTYLEPRLSRLYHMTPRGLFSETTLLLGFGALTLAIVGLLWLRHASEPRSRLERLLGGAVWGCVGLGLFMVVMHRPLLWLGPLSGLMFSMVGATLLVLVVARHAAEGWRRRRAPWPLTEREWVSVLLGLAVWAFLLSLGPVVRVAHVAIGSGLHAWLYPVLLPLHAVRFVTRFGILVVFVGAFLAGLGLKWLDQRVPTWSRLPVLAAVTLILLVEYANFPLAYGPVAAPARPVDLVIGADPDDAVVLEWPTNVPGADADAMLRSLAHGKYVVNGFAGFDHDWLRELSSLLMPSEGPFPRPEALAVLRQIYPLRYLVVRLADPDNPDVARRAWLALRHTAPPGFRFRGTFGDTDLYELLPMPERGARIERKVSYAFLRAHSLLRIVARPLAVSPDLDQWVDVLLNGRSIERIPLPTPATAATPLTQELSRVAPNVITLRYGYRRPFTALDARYRIGGTGVLAPGDLVVRSSGDPANRIGSVRFNAVELSPDRRGYNLVAFDPTGRVLGAAVFDTFGSDVASRQLAAWTRALPPGTIVAGAVRDEASGRLAEAAVEALRTLGVVGDLRGRFRQAHAFVGVTGAAPGSALERLGTSAVDLMVGRADEERGLDLTGFALRGPSDRP